MFLPHDVQRKSSSLRSHPSVSTKTPLASLYSTPVRPVARPVLLMRNAILEGDFYFLKTCQLCLKGCKADLVLCHANGMRFEFLGELLNLRSRRWFEPRALNRLVNVPGSSTPSDKELLSPRSNGGSPHRKKLIKDGRRFSAAGPTSMRKASMACQKHRGCSCSGPALS